MSVQVLTQRLNNTSGGSYGPVSSSAGFTANNDQGQQPWSGAGTFTNLRVTLLTAPGSGKSRTFTLNINGSNTALTVTISDAALTASDTTHTVSVAAGDSVMMVHTDSGTPTAAGNIQFSLDFNSTTAGLSVYGGRCSLQQSDGTTQYYTLFNPPNGAAGWTRAQAEEPCPIDATITRLDLRIGDTVGLSAGLSYVATIFKNAVKQDGSGGTVNTTCTLAGSGSFAGPLTATSTFTLDVAPGDLLCLEIVDNNANLNVGYGCAVVADVDGESIYCGGDIGTPSASSTQYTQAAYGEPEVTWATIEDIGVQLNVGITPFTLGSLRAHTTVAPGSGKSFTLSLRQNGASPVGAPTLTISDAETADVGTGSLLLATGDLINMRMVPSGTPTTGIYRWSFGMLVATPIVGSFVLGVNTTVNATNAGAFGLDGNTNTHSEAGVFKVFGKMAGTEYLELAESAAPSGVADKGRIWIEDNGAGKSRLMIQFGSGAAQQIAIEP